MRKALALALAWLSFLGPAASAANFDAGRITTVPVIQMTAALQTALPALNLPLAEHGTLNILLDRLQIASPAGISTIENQAAPTASPDPQAVLGSVQNLRERYSDDALKNLSPAELGQVAAQFFDRMQTAGQKAPLTEELAPSAVPVLERASVEKPAPAAPRSLYLLSKPLEVSAKLGPVAQIGHYAFEIGFHAVKSYLLWRAGVHFAAVAVEFAWSAAKGPAMISIQSMGDLQARYWWVKLKTLKKLARIPHVERIAVLTGTETRFNRIVASSQDNHGLIFLETSEPLDAAATRGHGAPLLIRDARAARIKLSLEVAGQEHPSSWTPSLQDLLDRKPIPEDVANAWRAQIGVAKKDMRPWRRFFDMEFERNLKVHAVLIDSAGTETPLGVLSQGQSTKHLLGITRTDQAVRWAKAALGLSKGSVQTLFHETTTYPRRSIPLGDTTVEHGRTAFSLRELPSRLWRRLLGRLIREP